MIQFRCNCGHLLRVPESEAGDSTQCPKCGRLRSVPTLDELPSLTDDGTFRLNDDARPAPAPVPEPTRPAGASDTRSVAPISLEYAHVGTRGTADRRPGGDSALRVGDGRPAAARPVDPRFVERPKYDPDTGERITAIGVEGEADASPAKPAARPVKTPPPMTVEPADADVVAFRDSDPEPAALADADFEPAAPAPRASPVVAQPAVLVEAAPAAKPEPRRTLSYAGRDARPTRRPDGTIPLVIRDVHWYTIPLELFQPANILVILIIFACHVFIQAVNVIVIGGAIPLAIVTFGLWLMIAAHYGVVLEETGPDARDEMPALLRNASFYEDIFRPLTAMLFAAAICALPFAGVASSAARFGVAWGPTVPLLVFAAAAGLVMFPAVWLTLATSGTLHNLLPHRVWAVATRGPAEYAAAVVLLILMLATYGAGLFGTSVLSAWAAGWTSWVGGWRGPALAAGVSYPLLALGIYFAHAFAWMLGKLYQNHHDEFPWVLQRHVSTRTDAAKAAERKKIDELRAAREAQARRAKQPSQSSSSGLAARP